MDGFQITKIDQLSALNINDRLHRDLLLNRSSTLRTDMVLAAKEFRR